MASPLSERKRSLQLIPPISTCTPIHDPSSSATSGSSPECADQKRLKEETAGAGDQLQHVPAPLVSTDQDEETGTPEQYPQTLVSSNSYPDCMRREQGKKEPAGAYYQLQHVSSYSGTTDKNEEMDMDIVQEAGQLPAISNPFFGCAGQEHDEILGASEQLQHVPSHSTANEEIVIAAIRANDVALGLRRLPAGFYVVLRHNGLEWRTENKPSLMNNDVVEWSGPIPISSDLSAIICLEVYASFEFQPVLGAGEHLRKLTATVGQLLDRTGEDTPFTFLPKDGDVVSPCSSVQVTVKRQKCENSDALGSRVVDPHWSTPEPRGQLEDATNQGHIAITRYRKDGEKKDLEGSIQQFERALDVCRWDDPRRATAKSNLGIAKLILSQVEDTDGLLEATLWLHRDALTARPSGHPDRPLTLIQLASVHLARFQRRGHIDGVGGENAERLLREAIELSSTESYEKRAATVMLKLCAAHGGGRVQSSQSSMERDSPSLADEDPWSLSTWLLEQFEQFGDLAALQQAITILEGLVESMPNWDRDYCEMLGDLGVALSYRFERLGQISDLEDAISRKREAVHLSPDGHPDKPSYLNNLGSSLETRFSRLGQLSDLEDAISTQREAVHLTRDGHTYKPDRLNNLGNSLETRFSRLGQLSDLEDAISMKREAVHLSPDEHPHKPMYLNNLGTSLQVRFSRLGQLSDLEDAILTQRAAVQLIPDGHPHKPGYLNNLGSSLETRFSRLGQLSDLEDAILTQREAVHLNPNGHPDKPMYLHNLGTSLQTRFLCLGQLSDLEDAISRKREAVQLSPDGHPDKPDRLNNLGNSLETRFSRFGQLSDLEDAISTQREAVHLSLDGHPDKPGYLNNLGNSLQIRFLRLGQLSDLEDAISTKGEAVWLTPDGHPDRPMYLNNLGISLETCFSRLGQLSDLENAILAQMEAVHLSPDSHLDKPGYLNNLGNSLQIRFLRLGQLNDLEDAISTKKEAVKLTPDGHPDKPMYLDNLGISLETRFSRLGQLSDLEDSISTKKEAVHLSPDGHPQKLVIMNSLANSFTARFFHLGQVSDIEHALLLSSHIALIPIGPPTVRFSASQLWIQCARLIHHPSLLHAYSVAVSLFPKLAWIGLSLSHRYDELVRSANVVREAAATALEAGFPETALEWLEQGRSVIWGDLFQLRRSYDELSSAHPDHASRLHVLSTELDQASAAHEQSLSTFLEQSPSAMDYTPESLRRVADRHRALAIERDKLLQEIRRLPGFNKFLLRKSFSQLRAAAHSGPVVVLNAAKTRCDALIIVANVDHVIHVPLPNFTSERCTNLQIILKGFVRDTRAGKLGQSEGVSWDHILSPLWKYIVKPVLDALAFSVTSVDPSRIFWCPAGPLAFLPIHAAGFYNEQYSERGHKVFDFVISSYVPSLSTLVPSLSAATLPSGDLRLLLVPQPDSDGQAKLPGVARELRRINRVVSNSPVACTTLKPSDGTVEEVLGLMRHADWVHFACHGVQDGVDSGLCLANQCRLKLGDIVGLSRPRGGLAFLSACQTAKGEQHLSDEAIHIAAGMLFAGYGGVIGTMWSISDAVAPDVAKDVYEELLGRGPRADYRRAAWALHEATKDLRRRGKPFDEWIPFIHVGL